MSPTIYEVAKKSGVSIGTVSRVLNGSPRTARATRARVLQVIDELDYQPLAVARGLARRKTSAIGVVVPSFSGRHHSAVLRSIQSTLAQHNLDLILYGMDNLQEKAAFLRRALQQRRIDGILLVSMQPSGALAVECKRRRVPLVLAGDHHHQFDSVTVDNQAGASLAIQHVLRLGHRQFAIVAGHRESSSTQRMQDCQQALEEAGVAYSDHIVIHADSLDKETAELNGGAGRLRGYSAMKDFLKQHLQNGDTRRLPLAVFLACDSQTLGAIKAVEHAGLRIPDDVALIGFDDSELAQHAGLIVIRQPKAEIGNQAVKRMLALLQHPGVPLQHSTIQPRLVVP